MDGNGFEHLKTKEKVSVKDGKIVGKFVRYVLPKETKIFKANKGYIFIIIFKERKERQCYAVSKVSPDSCQDRIKLTYNVRRNIISKIVFEDA